MARAVQRVANVNRARQVSAAYKARANATRPHAPTVVAIAAGCAEPLARTTRAVQAVHLAYRVQVQPRTVQLTENVSLVSPLQVAVPDNVVTTISAFATPLPGVPVAAKEIRVERQLIKMHAA
jgi:hypothetical protein